MKALLTTEQFQFVAPKFVGFKRGVIDKVVRFDSQDTSHIYLPNAMQNTVYIYLGAWQGLSAEITNDKYCIPVELLNAKQDKCEADVRCLTFCLRYFVGAWGVDAVVNSQVLQVQNIIIFSNFIHTLIHRSCAPSSHVPLSGLIQV